VTCRIASWSGLLPLLSRIVSCSLPSSASRASPSPLVAAEMKIQPLRGRVKEKVSPALVGAASNNIAVRLLSLWGGGWAWAERGQMAKEAKAKMVKVFQRAVKRRQRAALGGSLFICEG
jgi:hypothetical protein